MDYTLKLENGYTGTFEHEEGARCPWKEYDGQPPILTRGYRESWDNHGTDLTAMELFDLIPDTAFQGDALADTIRKLEFEDGPEYFQTEAAKWNCPVRDVMRESFQESATTLEGLATVASLAGLKYESGTSRGYSQSDWASVFVVATPAWIEAVGIAPEHVESSLKASFKLWGHWAWGDVYYLSEVTRPDGSTFMPEYQSTFYGDPTEEDSGGPGHLREIVEADAAEQAKEAAEAAHWAARDSVTI